MAAASLAVFPFPDLSPRLTNSHERVKHDLRVSVTDRCNHRCVYCRSGEAGAQYPDGKIRTCIFSEVEHDLYGLMRAGRSDGELQDRIFRTIRAMEAHRRIGEPDFLKASRSMVHIGG